MASNLDASLDFSNEFDMTLKGICSRCECAVCGCVHNTNGQVLLGTESHIVAWWAILVIVIVANILFEIPGLMYVALKYSTSVAGVLDIRLSPLNPDRAFVADSLVRAAFELGNPNSAVLGVDPGAASSGELKQALMVLIYKLKVVITGLLMKTLIGKVTDPDFGLWAKPWLGMVIATILWDGLIAAVIIMQAQIRGMGVFTSMELFNEVMEEHYKDSSEISEFGKLQIARAVGVAIVKNGSMYPTMELLLRHAIQYLGLRGTVAVSEPGVLDDEMAFIAGISAEPPDPDAPQAKDRFFRKGKVEHTAPAKTVEEANEHGVMTETDQECVLCILLLAFVLTGSIGTKQKKLMKRCCEVIDDTKEGQKRVHYFKVRKQRKITPHCESCHGLRSLLLSIIISLLILLLFPRPPCLLCPVWFLFC